MPDFRSEGFLLDRILLRDNLRYSDEKSPAGKTDDHTMGACYEVLDALKVPGGGGLRKISRLPLSGLI